MIQWQFCQLGQPGSRIGVKEQFFRFFFRWAGRQPEKNIVRSRTCDLSGRIQQPDHSAKPVFDSQTISTIYVTKQFLISKKLFRNSSDLHPL